NARTAPPGCAAVLVFAILSVSGTSRWDACAGPSPSAPDASSGPVGRHPGMRRSDWAAWHRVYDDPSSKFSTRLRLVQARVRAVLDRHPAGPIRIENFE